MGRNKGPKTSLLIRSFSQSSHICCNFFGSLINNITRALDTTNNIIIVGDMTEDRHNVSNLKDILILNSLNNIISQPTRQQAHLDPIICYKVMSFIYQCLLEIPPKMSDHRATYVSQSNLCLSSFSVPSAQIFHLQFLAAQRCEF